MSDDQHQSVPSLFSSTTITKFTGSHPTLTKSFSDPSISSVNNDYETEALVREKDDNGYILLNISCGFLYGLIYGFLSIIMYACIGLTVSFWLCRYLLMRNLFCKKLNLKTTVDQNRIIQTLIKILMSQDGYKIILLGRLTPIPLGLQNGFYSITNIEFRTYLFWSLCGLAPTQFIYCFLGTRLHSMTDLILIDKRTKTVGIITLVAECFMTLFLTWYVFHTAKKVLNRLLLTQTIEKLNMGP
ncbi:unnamed protein product [Didymodactylos carnosus]|uniref:VTT domain-containing protein n=1 Tax=Didymodactylos carnosus TaxID=1234261 RepID=A0A8S2PBR7_9BILA|nr:unnamed protein product [Didymodactylos carnosus]CAF4035205.1 unnamed protein product [Didymodactylos carnosus]